MLVEPHASHNTGCENGHHDNCQNDRFPDMALAGVAFFQCLPVICPLTALRHKCVDQNNYNDSPDHHVRAKASFHAESRVVEDAVARGGRFQLKDGILGHDAAVGKAEHDTLGEVPGRMGPNRRPEAVPVIHDQREQDADQENLKKAQLRDAGIAHMQRHEDQRIHEHRNDRPAVAPAKLLVQVAPIYNFFRAGLNQNTDQEGEKGYRSKSAVGKLDISHDDGQKDAGPVQAKTEQDTCQDRFQVIPVAVVQKGFPHRPVILKEKDNDHECDPNSVEFKIFQQKLHAVRIAEQLHSDRCRRDNRFIQDKTQERSEQCENDRQHRCNRDYIRPASARAQERFLFLYAHGRLFLGGRLSACRCCLSSH